MVVQGLVEIEERPNLVKLTKYIEGGIEPVLEGSLRRFYDRLGFVAATQHTEMFLDEARTADLATHGEKA